MRIVFLSFAMFGSLVLLQVFSIVSTIPKLRNAKSTASVRWEFYLFIYFSILRFYLFYLSLIFIFKMIELNFKISNTRVSG